MKANCRCKIPPGELKAIEVVYEGSVDSDMLIEPSDKIKSKAGVNRWYRE